MEPQVGLHIGLHASGDPETSTDEPPETAPGIRARVATATREDTIKSTGRIQDRARQKAIAIIGFVSWDTSPKAGVEESRPGPGNEPSLHQGA